MTTATNPNPRRRRELVVGEVYRAGERGVTLSWRDGSATIFPPRSTFRLEQRPVNVSGRLFRRGRIRYEAPEP